jgi:glycosyltransferase involved in cell wall biosynthesis
MTDHQSFGINLIGNFSGLDGISQTGQEIARKLISSGVKVSILNCQLYGNETAVIPDDIKPFLVNIEAQLHHPVNLYTLPLELLRSLMQKYPIFYTSKKRFHIASFWWELTEISELDKKFLSKFDVIVTFSNFVSELAKLNLHLTHHIAAKYPISTINARSDRALFGFPCDTTVFVFSFHVLSNVYRKNPFGLINAFKLAFDAEIKNVRLVIRIADYDSVMHASLLRQLQNYISHDNRIELNCERLTRAEILSFYASSDVYISLHRSEGFGLGLIESMGLSKPVIATAWSGNTDFMNHINSCLVRTQKMLEYSGNYAGAPAPFGAKFAEPLIEDAAFFMRRLHWDRNYRLLKGEKSYEGFLSYQEKANDPEWIFELIECWRLQDLLPSIHNKFSHQLI